MDKIEGGADTELKIFSLLSQEDICNILDILSHNNSTKEQLILLLRISDEKLTEKLNLLLDAGLICKSEIYYMISQKPFEKAITKLMQYCSPQYGGDGLHGLNRVSLDKFFLISQENAVYHAPFEKELAFYESVRSGNLETVKTLFTKLGGAGFGVLSSDPLRNLKYHLVVSIAMITRFCINGGMPPEKAYSLSDIYVMKVDECISREEIDELHYEMIIDFTRRMRQIQNRRIYSKPIINALDYISDNLHNRILIQEIADFLSLSVPYFSRLFKEEIGVTFSEYVTVKKIEAAANMLQFSDYSAVEISNLFNFSSHSYFIKVFKKHMGMTPKEYRKNYYKVGWMDNNSKM